MSVRSVERWRRAWRAGGLEGLRSAGPANSPTVSDSQFAVLEEELGKGPAAHGFEDERWTLARVQAVSLSAAAGEAEHDWLTTFRLPPHAPDPNPVEAIWSLVRRTMANTAFDTPDDLDRILRPELRRIQLRPHPINGCLTATGLPLVPPTPP